MKALEYMLQLHEVCQFQTKEGIKVGVASKSEVKRWIMNGAIEINHYKLQLDDVIDFPVLSLIMFPKKHRTTLV